MIVRVFCSASALLMLCACGSQPQPDNQATAPEASAAPTAILAIRSDSITLPEDNETFGEGPAATLLTTNCAACHSADMIRYQPPLTRKQWTATVEKMREVYRAPIDPAQRNAIVDALISFTSTHETQTNSTLTRSAQQKGVRKELHMVPGASS